MKDLDYYLTRDYAARRRTMLISVVGGAAIGAAAQLLGVSVDRAVVMCVAAAGTIEITLAFKYRRPIRKLRNVAIVVPLRRYLVRAGLSAASIVILSLFRFPRIEAAVIERKLQQASGNPDNPENARVAQKTLAIARAGLLHIDVCILENTGTKFMQTADHSPEAWPAAREYLSYRSFINLDSAPAPAPTQSSGKSKYRSSVTFLPNPSHPERHVAYKVSFAGGYESGDKAARLESFDNPQSEDSEFAFFIIDGGLDTIVLDRMYMKHVIIRNADVQYDGGPARMEDVYFVNCVFHSRFKLTRRAIDLGRVILTAAATNFVSLDQLATGL